MTDENDLTEIAKDVADTAVTIGQAVGGTIVSVAAPFFEGVPAPTNGGFTFTPEELGAVITEWEALRDSLMIDLREAEYLARIVPPGQEFASNDFTNSANPSGKAFLEATKRMIRYTTEYIDALKKARDKLTVRDEQAQEDISKAGGSQG